jgi:hypothetical protein
VVANEKFLGFQGCFSFILSFLIISLINGIPINPKQPKSEKYPNAAKGGITKYERITIHALELKRKIKVIINSIVQKTIVGTALLKGSLLTTTNERITTPTPIIKPVMAKNSNASS